MNPCAIFMLDLLCAPSRSRRKARQFVAAPRELRHRSSLLLSATSGASRDAAVHMLERRGIGDDADCRYQERGSRASGTRFPARNATSPATDVVAAAMSPVVVIWRVRHRSTPFSILIGMTAEVAPFRQRAN